MTFRVRALFTWPWGQPGEHDFGPFDRYLAELVAVSCGDPDMPFSVVGAPPDEPWRPREYPVRIERAMIVEAS